MNSHMDFEHLLKPGKIGQLEIKNRFVMASMGSRLAGIWGEVNDATIEWYASRARGGVGLITVEASHVAAALFPVRGVISMIRVDDDCFCPGLYTLTEAIHQAGAKASIQLSVGKTAARGSKWMPGLADLEEEVGKGPSAVRFPDGVIPKEMTSDEIRQTVQMFGKAAARVQRVGFDAIELHAHFHSLAGCFMSPLFNKRTDEYGGSLDNRLRFLTELIESMRKKVGPFLPIIVKYSIDEYVRGGRDLNDGLAIAKKLEQAGVDAIDVSRCQAGSNEVPYAPLYWPAGFMVPLAEALKRVVNIPIIVGGSLGDPHLAEQVLQKGQADFISLGRPLIADPDLPKKAQSGRVREIRPCIADNWCFEVFGKSGMRCTLNAVAGREIQYGEIKPAAMKKKVVIVGAGPGGMEAARVAGLKGHDVVLYEKTEALGGGQLALASAPPHKSRLSKIALYYSEILKGLSNVKVHLGVEANAETVLAERPDAVIVATGGKSSVPVGSSRVDLQACKLEYSIVSPK